MVDAQIVLDAECCLSHVGPFMMSIWRGPVTDEAVTAHHLVSRKLRRQYRNYGMLLLVEAKAPPPVETRALVEKLYRDLEPGLLCLALVLQGEGFRLGAARAVMASVLHERRFPRQTFTDLHLASAWLIATALEHGLAAPRAEISEAMENVYWAYSWQPDVATRPFGPKLS